MSGLSERDMRILAFERRGWRSPGVKEQAIAEVLDMPATRYYQLLNELIDRPEALAFDPVLVKRLRAQRARRQRMRSPGSKGAKGRPRGAIRCPGRPPRRARPASTRCSRTRGTRWSPRTSTARWRRSWTGRATRGPTPARWPP